MPNPVHVIRARLVLIVVALSACSPSLGNDATPTPTRFAIALASATATTSAPTFTPEATATETRVATAVPGLPLRTDLPALTLRDWPRPANDNGRCIHFLPTGYFSPRDFEIQIPRLKDLQMRWVLAIYSDENQLRLAAQHLSRRHRPGVATLFACVPTLLCLGSRYSNPERDWLAAVLANVQ